MPFRHALYRFIHGGLGRNRPDGTILLIEKRLDRFIKMDFGFRKRITNLHKDPFLNSWEESYRLPRQSPTLSARSSSHSTAVVQLLGAIEPYRFAAVGE